MIVAEVLMTVGIVGLLIIVGAICYKLGKLFNKKETK